MKNCRMAKVLSLLLAAVLIVSMLPSSSLTARAAGSWKWTRIAGSTRFNTMKAITQEAYKDSEKNTLKTIILATGESFPDALSGSALAGVFNCPIILTATKSLSGQAKSEIQRLAAKDCTVLILGGTGAVSQAVEDAVRALGVKVERVAGSTREKTAIATYKKGAAAANGFKNSDTAIVTTGYNYADALSISPYAYASKTPIFLTKKDGTLSADMKNALKSAGLKKAIIVGGTGAVAAAAETDLKNMGLTVLRLKGNNRYQTSAQISKWEMGLLKNAAFQPAVKMTNAGMGVATGENYPDALASASLLGKYSSVLMLVDASKKANKTALQTNIDELVKPYAATMGKGYIFGGTGAVTKEVEDLLNKAVEGAETEPGTLTVGYADVSNEINPFIKPSSDYEKDVYDLLFQRLITKDRNGMDIRNAINGEKTTYNGTEYLYTGPSDISVNYNENEDVTTYTIKLRQGMKFSDGVEVTADDLIFTYYILFDPQYSVSSSKAIEMNYYRILGRDEYLNQITGETYNKYRGYVESMLAAGHNNYQSGSEYSKEHYEAFWKKLDAEGLKETRNIVDYVIKNYLTDDYVSQYYNENATVAEIQADNRLRIAYGMALWGFGSFNDAGLFEDSSGNTYDLKTKFPAYEDFYNAIYEGYNGNMQDAWDTETISYSTPLTAAETWYYHTYGSKDPAAGQIVSSISGLKKLDKYTIQLQTEGYDGWNEHDILNIYIAPMHYYGDSSKYDYANGRYGFNFGEVDKVVGVLDPLGAGPYKYESCTLDPDILTLRANSNYYKGCPKISTIRCIEVSPDRIADAVAGGTADMVVAENEKSLYDAIKAKNSNSQISGDVLTTTKVDYLAQGYIGMNAKTANVNGDPGSDASKAFRKAIATLISAYRNEAYEAYFGEAAEVSDYPTSEVFWAVPKPSDPDYKTAFSVDASGKALYSTGMTVDQRHDAALKGALSWFKKAGYTVTNNKITAAPEGGRLDLKVFVPIGNTGSHPSTSVMRSVSEVLKAVGFTMTVEEVTGTVTGMLAKVEAGEVDIWCAAKAVRNNPEEELFFEFFSNSDSYYNIGSNELDEKLLLGESTVDLTSRKAVYRQCMDLIMDSAVYIPAYQRKDIFTVSTKRVKTSSLTPDITSHWRWVQDVEKLEMN